MRIGLHLQSPRLLGTIGTPYLPESEEEPLFRGETVHWIPRTLRLSSDFASALTIAKVRSLLSAPNARST
jgi:hypothetical protein